MTHGMKCILGRKLHMAHVFANGAMVPVTLVQAGPCIVTEVRNMERDGYRAIQLGYGKAKRLSKPRAGQLKDLPAVAVTTEFRIPLTHDLTWKRGDVIEAQLFQAGDRVHVSAISKGKGFQGVVKRHHFHGHPTTHGHKDQARMPGSIGAGGVQHVLKGRRMAGHMGAERVTIQNLKVLEIREGSVLVIAGSIPGARNSLVEIRSLA